MSRYPHEKTMTEDKFERINLEDKTIKATCYSTVAAYVETLPIENINVLEVLEEPGQTLAQRDLREIRKAQRNDDLMDKWRIAIIDQKIPNKMTSREDFTMPKQYRNFKLNRGVLFRVFKVDDREIEQLVIPRTYRDEILKGLHDKCGHPGPERTIRIIRERYYWPGVGKDVTRWKEKCDRCIRRKSTADKAPLVSVHSAYPLDLVCINYLTLEPSKGNIGNILIITDHYTKFAKAVPTRNQTAKTTT